MKSYMLAKIQALTQREGGETIWLLQITISSQSIVSFRTIRRDIAIKHYGQSMIAQSIT